jgi:hypothetical protein
MEVRFWEKEGKKMSKDNSQKRLTGVQCWLMQGQEPNEKKQPILSTGALVGAGSL